MVFPAQLEVDQGHLMGRVRNFALPEDNIARTGSNEMVWCNLVLRYAVLCYGYGMQRMRCVNPPADAGR